MHQKSVALIKDGAQNRPIKKIKQGKRRKKMIRIADKSPEGLDTVKEYESDIVASDSADKRKIRAAEKRALTNKKKRFMYRLQ